MCLYKQVVAMQRAAAQQHVEINRLKALLRNGKKTQKGAGKGSEHMSQAHLEMLQASVVLFSLTVYFFLNCLVISNGEYMMILGERVQCSISSASIQPRVYCPRC